MKTQLENARELLAIAKSSSLADSVGNEAISYASIANQYIKVKAIAKRITDGLAIKDDYKVVSISMRDVTLSSNVTEAGYAAIRNIDVFKAVSFSGGTLAFLTMLDKLIPSIQNVDAMLIDLEANLGRFINSPEDLTKPCTKLKALKLPNADKVLDEFSDYFLGKGGVDYTKVSKIYPNLKSISESSSLCISLTEEFNGNAVQTVLDRADTLSKTIQYLEDAMDDANLEMTKDWRKEIGNKLYMATTWMAIYSLYLTKLIAVTVAHRDTVQKLNGI